MHYFTYSTPVEDNSLHYTLHKFCVILQHHLRCIVTRLPVKNTTLNPKATYQPCPNTFLLLSNIIQGT